MVLLFERVLRGRPGGEDQLHGLGGFLAALHEPFVSLEQERAGEADHGGVGGEHPDDKRSLREAKRQPLIEDGDVRPPDCAPMHGRVRAQLEISGSANGYDRCRA
jgi:hypothetical protein